MKARQVDAFDKKYPFIKGANLAGRLSCYNSQNNRGIQRLTRIGKGELFYERKE